MLSRQDLEHPPAYNVPLPEGRHRGIKTDRIFRILLCNVGTDLTKYRIAKLAQAQQIQVSLLLRRLEKSGLVKGTRVVDPKGLLLEWSRLHVKSESRSYLLKDILNILRNASLEYALTTYQAETMVNHYLFPSKTDVYIKVDQSEEWHDFLVGNGALVGGGNVRLIWYDDQVFYNAFFVNGYRLASIPQIIVDLVREGGVTVQAAEMMMKNYRSLLQLNRSKIDRPKSFKASSEQSN
jgi:hypothetical protein